MRRLIPGPRHDGVLGGGDEPGYVIPMLYILGDLLRRPVVARVLRADVEAAGALLCPCGCEGGGDFVF